MEEKGGEEEVVGMMVGKNQTGPNYRNHNESVSRGTLLPGKHHKRYLRTCSHELLAQARTHTNFSRTHKVHRCYIPALTVNTFLLYSLCKEYTSVHILYEHARLCVHMHTNTHSLLSNLVWILIISLARPV